jgi:hypothetical protein
VRIGCNWLRIGSGVGSSEHGDEASVSVKGTLSRTGLFRVFVMAPCRIGQDRHSDVTLHFFRINTSNRAHVCVCVCV